MIQIYFGRRDLLVTARNVQADAETSGGLAEERPSTRIS